MGQSVRPVLIRHTVGDRVIEWGQGECNRASGAEWWYNADNMYLFPPMHDTHTTLYTMAEIEHVKQVQREMSAK